MWVDMGHNIKCLFIYLFALLSFVSCQDGVKTKAEESNSGSEVVGQGYDFKNVVYNELTHGAYCSQLNEDSVEFRYTEQDLRAMGEVMTKIFKKKGLVVNRDSMKARIDSMFHQKVSKSAYYELNFSRIRMFLSDSLFLPEQKQNIDISYSETRHTQRNAVFFDEHSGLLLSFRCVPEVMDVYSEFPDFVDAERKMYWLTRKWSEEDDIERYRNLIIEAMYHLNKYTYTNDIESLKWLCKTTPDIAQSFFVEFRKENEPVLNKFILDKVKSREMSIEALIAEKNADGSLYIRDSLLNYLMNDRTQAKLNRTTIHQCFLGFLGKDTYADKLERFPDILFNIYTLDQRREIIGHILNMVFKSYDLTVRDMFMQEAIEMDEGLLQFYTDNDYFELEYLRRGISVYRMRFLSDH